ncbi:hypothetical protein CR513_43509, partial [Mucuna pruriens]
MPIASSMAYVFPAYMHTNIVCSAESKHAYCRNWPNLSCNFFPTETILDTMLPPPPQSIFINVNIQQPL